MGLVLLGDQGGRDRGYDGELALLGDCARLSGEFGDFILTPIFLLGGETRTCWEAADFDFPKALFVILGGEVAFEDSDKDVEADIAVPSPLPPEALCELFGLWERLLSAMAFTARPALEVLDGVLSIVG